MWRNGGFGMGTTVPRRTMALTMAISASVGMALATWIVLAAVQSAAWTFGFSVMMLTVASAISFGAAVLIYAWLSRIGALNEQAETR